MRLIQKSFTAVVNIGAETHEIKERDVQPKTEESSFFLLSPKLILTVLLISAVVNVGLHFGFESVRILTFFYKFTMMLDLS